MCVLCVVVVCVLCAVGWLVGGETLGTAQSPSVRGLRVKPSALHVPQWGWASFSAQNYSGGGGGDFGRGEFRGENIAVKKSGENFPRRNFRGGSLCVTSRNHPEPTRKQ